MDELDVIGRLRSLARQDLDEGLMASHLDRAGSASPGASRGGRIAVAAAVAALFAIPGAAFALSAADTDPAPPKVLAGPGSHTGPAGMDGEELTCTGPPPFAGEVPAGETTEERANRASEAEEHEAWRIANCPEDADAGEQDGEEGGRPAGTACSGPPPFAEVPAESADPTTGVVPSARSQEAEAFVATRAACGDGAPERVAGEGAPQGPPEGTPQGPPAGTPQGPPAGTPQGPPAGTPQGPPEGMPQGPPAGTPEGPPQGPPEGIPGRGLSG